MRDRSIWRSDVEAVLEKGERIEDYPEDRRGHSYLMLGRTDNGPLHVVAADAERTTTVVTAYRPDPDLWSDDLRERL